MSDALASIALLIGVLLIAAGIVIAFVTGFDIPFLAGGIVAVILGIVLLWKYRGNVDTSSSSEGSTGSSGRAVQKPDTAARSERPKLHDKL
jgi:hypothetical protein